MNRNGTAEQPRVKSGDKTPRPVPFSQEAAPPERPLTGTNSERAQIHYFHASIALSAAASVEALDAHIAAQMADIRTLMRRLNSTYGEYEKARKKFKSAYRDLLGQVSECVERGAGS